MSAAIFYNPEGFDTSGPKLMGRHAAGEGFLRGWFRHASAPEKYCFAASPHAFEVFKNRAAALGGDPAQCRFIPFQNPRGLAKPGTLYLPDPNLGHFAWRRRWLDPKAYSLSGVTHTLASEGVMDQIGALLTAPVEPWDALVCTSKAGKNAVLRVLSEWRDYQTARFRGTPPPLPQLPVIPLGVDAKAFAPGPDWERERTIWREKLGIGPDDVAALFVGRLSFHAKAHPLPAYLALEAAAERTGKRIHFIQAGRFSNELIEEQFVWGANTAHRRFPGDLRPPPAAGPLRPVRLFPHRDLPARHAAPDRPGGLAGPSGTSTHGRVHQLRR